MIKKPLSEFYSAGKYYMSECKKCSSARANRYKIANPDKRRQYTETWRKKNRNSIKIKSQQILDGMVYRSKIRGFDRPEFTRHEIAEIIENGKCAKTNMPFRFDQSVYSKSPWTPVPDRIDSSKGYTKQNVQWVSHIYNSAKQDFTDAVVEEFVLAYTKYRPPYKCT